MYRCAIIRWYDPSYFCLMLKIFTCCYVIVIYPIITSSIIFIRIIIHFVALIMPHTSWYNRIIAAMPKQIIHWYSNIKMFCIVNKCVINFCRAWSKRCSILKGQLSILSAIIIIVFNCYYLFYKSICITIVTQI